MSNAKHSSASQLWYTPSNVIEMAREVLGVIDFDPASDPAANQIVRAWWWRSELGEHYSSWPEGQRIWLNPPGGLNKDRDSNCWVFWDALMQYREAGRLEHAIFLAFSIEALQTTQSHFAPMLSFPLCIPSKRIRFVSPAGSKNSPTHANAIVYVPGNMDRTDDFIRVFSQLGACKR